MEPVGPNEKGKIRTLESKYAVAHGRLILGCTAGELQFYLYLKLFAVNHSKAWPGYRRIQDELGWGSERLSNLIKLMVQEGRLVIENVGQRNIYDITWYDRLNEGTLKRGAVKPHLKPKRSDRTGFRSGTAPETEAVPHLKPKQNELDTTNENNEYAAVAAKGEIWGQKDLNAYLEKMDQDKRSHIRLIASYFRTKGVGVKPPAGELILSKEQASFQITRYSRAAARLAKAYPLERLEEVMAILAEHARFDWKLETVEKYASYSDEKLREALTSIKK